jgi:hypothetical protein
MDGDVTAATEIEVGTRALDYHIERLEAKLSFIIRSYNDAPKDLSNQYKKKIVAVKQEIHDAMGQRPMSNRVEQVSFMRYSTF